jgi:hypothetical protein
MSWMNSQSWKQNYLGSLRHDTSWDKPREDKPSRAGWVLYDNSSMRHHKNGSLYPRQAKTRRAAMRLAETRVNTRHTKQDDCCCCMIIRQCITIKWVTLLITLVRIVSWFFCFVASCGYWEMTWCWEGGDFVMKMATVVMPGE